MPDLIQVSKRDWLQDDIMLPVVTQRVGRFMKVTSPDGTQKGIFCEHMFHHRGWYPDVQP